MPMLSLKRLLWPRTRALCGRKARVRAGGLVHGTSAPFDGVIDFDHVVRGPMNADLIDQRVRFRGPNQTSRTGYDAMGISQCRGSPL